MEKFGRLVSLNKVCSEEYYYLGDNKIKAVLADISAEIYGGDIFGISADKKTAASLLGEIIACIRPYYSGKCVLSDLGIMQKKKVLLPHVFYIDSPDMLFENMTVLEYLMLLTMKRTDNPAVRQRVLLDMLVALGMDYISLSKVSVLTAQERLLVALVSSGLTPSQIIVANFCEYLFSVKECEILASICENLTKDGDRCVIICTMQANLIGVACRRVLYISNGRTGYIGEVKDLVSKYDKVKVLIRFQDTEKLCRVVNEKFPNLEVREDSEQGCVYIMTKRVSDEFVLENLVSELALGGVIPDNIKVNRGRVKNSFEEIDSLSGV